MILTFFLSYSFSVIYSQILEYSDSILVNFIFKSERTSIFYFESLCISFISFSILLVSNLACSSKVEISYYSFSTYYSIFLSPSRVDNIVCLFSTCFFRSIVCCFSLTVFS